MTTKQRKLVLFLVLDTVVIAGLAIWWFSRSPTAPISANPPAAVAQAVEAPATAPLVLPQALAGVVECHGTWSGQPFWLRLSDPDPALNGNRHLRLVYTPPVRAEVEGAAIHDSPELIVDSHMRIVQWDNRDGATGVMIADAGYTVTRELHALDGDTIALKTRALKQPAAWDLRLAPLLAVLVDSSDATWSVSAVDFWGSRAGERLEVQSDTKTITVAGVVFTLHRAPNGRVSRVSDAHEQAVITVTTWK